MRMIIFALLLAISYAQTGTTRATCVNSLQQCTCDQTIQADCTSACCKAQERCNFVTAAENSLQVCQTYDQCNNEINKCNILYSPVVSPTLAPSANSPSLAPSVNWPSLSPETDSTSTSNSSDSLFLIIIVLSLIICFGLFSYCIYNFRNGISRFSISSGGKSFDDIMIWRTSAPKEPESKSPIPLEYVKPTISATELYANPHSVLELMDAESPSSMTGHLHAFWTNADSSVQYLCTDRKSSAYFSDRKRSMYDRVRSPTAMSINKRTKHYISSEHLEVYNDQILGEGSQGSVFVGLYMGCKVAVKSVEDELSTYLEHGDLFFNVSNHPNICRYYGITLLNDSVYLISELYENKCLLNCMVSGKSFTLLEKSSMCRQLSAAICHLHLADIVHGDIALRNVLVDVSKMHVALTDFGLARRDDNMSKAPTIPIRWSSPELLQTKIFTKASDVYAFGITCIEILRDGQKPFHSLSVNDLIMELANGLSPIIEGSWPPRVKDILQACCMRDPDLRWKIRPIFDAWLAHERDPELHPG